MLKRALLSPLAICALAFSATVAHADPPTYGEGELNYDPPIVLGVTERGQTLFIEVEISGEISGPLTGEIHEQYTVVHHAKAGFNTYRGVLEFEGTVNDHEGTLTILTHGRQDPGMPFPTDTPWDTRWVIVGGGGELDHVQGRGTGELIGLDLFYEGRVHFSGH